MIFFRRGSWENYVIAGGKARDKGNYPEAEKHIAAAVKEAEGFGPQDPRLAASLENYAALRRETGRSDEAAKMEARAEAIRAKHAEKNPAN